MSFIKNPNFPDKKVSHVLISHYALEAQKALKKLKITPILTDNCELFDNPVQSHPDMLFIHLKNNKCIVQRSSTDLVKKMSKLGFEVFLTKNNYTSSYPNDIGLNSTFIGNYLIGRVESIDKVLLDFALQNNIKLINVNQGYSKCSICVVDENSIITEDESIYKTLKSKLDILKIESGSVLLNGYNYGFLGGCTGLINKNLLAINGEIKTHKNYNQISAFLKERKVEIISLKPGALEDIGSIIPIIEE